MKQALLIILLNIATCAPTHKEAEVWQADRARCVHTGGVWAPIKANFLLTSDSLYISLDDLHLRYAVDTVVRYGVMTKVNAYVTDLVVTPSQIMLHSHWGEYVEFRRWYPQPKKTE